MEASQGLLGADRRRAGVDAPRVAVLGLGAMGSALAAAFLEAGHLTAVWNRTSGRDDALVARGATRAETVAAAVRSAELVVICVLNADAAASVLEQAGDALAGRTVVQLGNGTPAEARLLAARADRVGAKAYLAGAILAVPSMVGGEGSRVLLSGSRSAWEAYGPVLEAIGAGTYLGEETGLAALYDLALLSGMYGLFGGFLHATALVGSAAGDVREFTSALLMPWLQAMTGALPELAEQVATRRYGGTESRLEMQRFALAKIVEASGEQGVDAGPAAGLLRLADRRVAAGGGDEDLSSLVEAMRVTVENRPEPGRLGPHTRQRTRTG